LHGEKAASVLLKMFINGNKRCHTTDTPYNMNRSLLSNANIIQSMISE